MVVRVWAEERRESWVGVKLVEGEGLDDEGAVEVEVEVEGASEGRRRAAGEEEREFDWVCRRAPRVEPYPS
jgi:hypothetical protein